MAERRTRVIIIGGGPAGLVLAIELGRRGVACVLLEEDEGPPQFPKANATTSRTMEHFRRLGFAAEIRALGLTEDYPQDIAYFTRFTRHELARVSGRSRREAREARESAGSRWPTPEPLHRGQQMFIEAVLKQQAERWPSADIRYGWRAGRLHHRPDGVSVDVEPLATGTGERIDADFAVGCDGGRSMVRETLGIRYEGLASEERDYLGGQMLAAYLRAPEFYTVVPCKPSWQYWAVNRQRRGVMIAIDGKELFVFHAQLPRGQHVSTAYALKCLALTTGRDLPCEILGVDQWTAGFTLVAEHFGIGRTFLAGDAAHLFTPTGGQGYNTSVDDAANLGWKLAAVCQGWGGENLLGTYEAERKPIAQRNTTFARAMADSIGRIHIPGALEDESGDGERARVGFGAQLLEHCRLEFDIPGIHFGAFYGSSPIIVGDGSAAPSDDWHHYTPDGIPGARAPHVWLDDDVSILDRFGADFTFVRFGTRKGPELARMDAAARKRGVPLTLLEVQSDEARTVYGADLALIRPDHHVAWRGDALPPDPDALLARVTGCRAGT